VIDQRFLIEPFEAAYLETWRSGRLDDKLAQAQRELADCTACPRSCHVDRMADEHTGTCRTGRYALVASAFPHHGEEWCLRGTHGSGTVFFGRCNLRCVFCQNWDISQQDAGAEMDAPSIATVMIWLQHRGCHNINFVTPEHVVPQVVEIVAAAIPRGLRLPIVYNTSAYDSLDSLALLDGLVDVYMPDFKFWNTEAARRLARAADYPEVARAAIAEMHRQVGVLRFGPDGIARRGVLVRHLVMPGMLDDTTAITDWLATEISPDTYVNLMGQYRPEHRVPGNPRYADIDRVPGPHELEAAAAAARRAGLWRLDPHRPSES